MATAAASERLYDESMEGEEPAWRGTASLWPRLGVRSRQIALITLLVAIVVMVATVANIAYLTGVIINRTEEQARQLSDQISYAVQQELAYKVLVDDPGGAYAALASENSSVRGLMESTIVTSRPVIYLYLTNESGEIIADPKGRNELAANRHMIGDTGVNRPDLSVFAREQPHVQLYQMLFGAPIYEFREPLKGVGSLTGELHIGVSAVALRRQLFSPIAINVVIGLLAIVGAAMVAILSANLLMKPLKAISTSIDHIESGRDTGDLKQPSLPRDEVITGVTNRLRQLGERLAGERSELEIMRGRLRQVISHLEERLLLINRDGRVILASPDAERILGLEGSDLTGLRLDESLGTGHPLVALVHGALGERRSVARSTVHVPHGSRTRQLLASVQYIEDGGEPVGAMVSLRDYESYQKFESQWDLSKKLADLGRITSGIAHEVKNPLNAMVIHLEILRSKLESGASDPSPQIEILDSEIKRLDRVVTTFLNFTRPVEVQLQPHDLNDLVRQVVTLASTEAQERGVSIKLMPSKAPLIVRADADLLKQALLNVIINGCQAMPEGGPLKVMTSREPDGAARISIRDRGVGIAPEARDHIFNLYHTTRKDGTGIGLAQAFRAVQLHNGSIRFDTEVGIGTTFEITLPASN
ncbi:MAG TPA: ATP-binding protein [Blastocatellia bacterium]|nr:ATP-binding protein [Blastocatellia bacterium]